MKTRGYKSNTIKSLVNNVKHKDRFKRKDTQKSFNRPVFITRYTASAKRIIKTIRHHWHNLQSNPTVGRFFPNYPIMAFKKNKNLKNYLVRAKLKNYTNHDQSCDIPQIKLPVEHQPPIDLPRVDPTHIPQDSISFCPIRSFFLHKYLNKSLKIHCTVTNRSFRVRGKLNCNSKNVIYLMQCKKCKNNISDKLAPVLDTEFHNMSIINTAQTQLLTNISAFQVTHSWYNQLNKYQHPLPTHNPLLKINSMNVKNTGLINSKQYTLRVLIGQLVDPPLNLIQHNNSQL